LVLDLTRLLPGPLCAMMLGDYGAEIIKIEDIKAGDPTRFAGLAGQVRLRLPRHGEHTTEVLKFFGYGSAVINSMKKRGIIKATD